MRLIGITANILVQNTRAVGTPMRLLLTFAGGRSLRVGPAGDGESMAIDQLPLDPASDMGVYGRVTVQDVAPLLDASLVGAMVSGAREMVAGAATVGLRLEFEGRGAFFLWVDGDELWWGDDSAFDAHLWPGDRVPATGPAVDI